MDIKPDKSSLAQTSQPSTTPRTAIIRELVSRLGQEFMAKVETAQRVSSEANKFATTLRIGGQTVEADADIELRPGQWIQVRATAKGLQITTLDPFRQTSDTAALRQPLADALPQQRALQVILKLMTPLLQQPDKLPAPLNQALAKVAEQIVLNRTKAGSGVDLSATVKDAIQRSGLFHEAQLNQTSSTTQQALNSNLKAAVSQAIGAIAQQTAKTGAPVNPPGSAGGAPATTVPPTGIPSAAQTTTQTSVSLTGTTIPAGSPTERTSISALSASTSSVPASLRILGGIQPLPLNLPLPGADELMRAPFQFPMPSIVARKGQEKPNTDATVGDILRRLASMLKRIEFNQLNSLFQGRTASTDNIQIQSWLLEIPYWNEKKELDILQLRIDQEERNQTNEESEKVLQWRLTLKFDLEELGNLHVQAALAPPRFSSLFWVDNPATETLVRNELTGLRERIQNLGLQVEAMECKQGQPPGGNQPLEQRLVDITL